MFVDSVKVTLRAGKGGNGVVAWRREKFIPKGGPSGGDGGKGGSIQLKTDMHIPSLEQLRNRRIICAENGQPGAGDRKSTRLNSSHVEISYAVFCLKKKKKKKK